MANFDLTRMAVKMVCPNNEVICDDKDLPGVYVQVVPQQLKDLIKDGDSTVHPAFMVNSKQISKLFIGKYQGKDHNNRIYSLPGEDPRAQITLDTYEQYCKNKGAGHHCITAAEWAFLALWCKKNNCQPKGNNQWGKDVSETLIQAIPTYYETGVSHKGEPARVATGTGPLTWSHDGTVNGIWDLNGNVWEWVSGIRLVKGELQVIPYNNAAENATVTGAESTEWRAINSAATGWENLFIEKPDGNGTTPSSIKLEYVTDHWKWQVDVPAEPSDTSRYGLFAKTEILETVSAFCKMFLRAMALAPEEGAEETDYNGDGFWANNAAAERCARRGGRWADGAHYGVFALSFDDPRSLSSVGIGGRPAYYEG